jgi:hypothetical protein
VVGGIFIPVSASDGIKASDATAILRTISGSATDGIAASDSSSGTAYHVEIIELFSLITEDVELESIVREA